jgi:hypothetical protein
MAGDKKKNITSQLKSRVALFFLLPLSVGSFGLILSYAKSKVLNDDNDNHDHPIHQVNFDADFVIPFLLTFVIVVVVMTQTSGFTSSAKGVVSWPKLIKKKTIVKKTVVVDDNGNVIEDEHMLKQIEEKLKKRVKKDE